MPSIKRLQRATVVFTASVGLALVFGTQALSVATTPTTIDSRSAELQKGDGGGWTVALGFTNLTDKKVTLTAKPSNGADKGCDLVLDHEQLLAAVHTSVNVTVPAGCKVGNDGIDFAVSAKSGTSPPVKFDVTAAPKPDSASKPEWRALWAFPIIFAGLVFAAAICLLLVPKNPNTELKYLDATWSFNDSWVSNVTVLGGLLAGIFGSSEVVTALLGEDAKSSIALATVGVAVAAAIIAAGPIILLSTKSKNDFVTLGGFLLGAAVTLSGAAGELWVVYRSGRRLDLGGLEHDIVGLAVAGFVVLGLYAIRTIPATIRHGTTEPDAPPLSDTLVAARLIVKALKAQKDVDTTMLERELGPDGEEFPAPLPGAAAPQPKRSALL
jgi:hypothetical protein